jgi:hypothetical protein
VRPCQGPFLVKMLPTTIAFTALMLIGLVGSTLMVIASILSPVQRNPVWYTFVLSWIVYCSIYLVLWFAGESDNPAPPLKLATAQSAVAAAVPTLYVCLPFVSLYHIITLTYSVASSSLAFVIEVLPLIHWLWGGALRINLSGVLEHSAYSPRL